jgi:hypothetical protein
MKKFAVTPLILRAASLIAHAAGIDGKWISEIEAGDADGKTYTHTSTFNLKTERGSLVGMLVQVSAAPWMKQMNGRMLDISDGKLEGDSYSFKVKLETKQAKKPPTTKGLSRAIN